MDLVFWMVLAVAVFWAVGAYNRLVRLRADVKQAFAGLDSQWRHQLRRVETRLQEQLVPGAAAHSMDLVPAADRPWIALKAASIQFVASLDAARETPLEPGSVAALSAAQDVLVDAWARVVAGLQDLETPQRAEPLQRDWEDQWRVTNEARARFNDAVMAYNAAIAQFPARLLAWLFSFRSGRSL